MFWLSNVINRPSFYGPVSLPSLWKGLSGQHTKDSLGFEVLSDLLCGVSVAKATKH